MASWGENPSLKAATDRGECFPLAESALSGRFCVGDTPTLADCVLVPQIFNAQRMDCRLDHVPTVMRVFAECMQLDAFVKTQPSACPDAT